MRPSLIADGLRSKSFARLSAFGYKIARLVRGGNFPPAYVYPAEWRPTRDICAAEATLIITR